MKTEYREVLVKRPVYIADDGKEFDDEEDCQDHEFDLLNGSFECYNGDFESVKCPDEATYVNLPTKKIIENFKRVCNWIGIVHTGVDEPGIYIYSDYGRGEWINMEKALARIRGGAESD